MGKEKKERRRKNGNDDVENVSAEGGMISTTS